METRRGRQHSPLLLWWGAVLALIGVVVVTAWLGLTQVSHNPDTIEARALRDPGVAAGESTPSPVELVAVEGGPWVPGTTFHITDTYPAPGVPFHVTECTATFSFGDASGRSYAVTAGHCGATGELVWPTTASTAQDFAVEVGRVIYTDLVLIAEVYHDVGIIEITDPARPMTFAGSAEQPADLLVGESSALLDNEVCKIGGTTGVTCGVDGGSERQQLYNDEGGFTVTEGRIATLCAVRGDSGGPVTATVAERSVIVGLVSGTRNEGEAVSDCADPAAAGMTVAYTPAVKIVEILQDVIPEAQVTPLAPGALSSR